MNPLLSRLKAIWLLPLSHQLERGWPLTTLRKITIFLWWGIKQVSVWDLTLGRCVQQSHPPDLSPSVLTDPFVPTGGVWVDGYRLSGAISIAWRAHPVILILCFISPKHYLFRFSVHLAHSYGNWRKMCFSLLPLSMIAVKYISFHTTLKGPTHCQKINNKSSLFCLNIL